MGGILELLQAGPFWVLLALLLLIVVGGTRAVVSSLFNESLESFRNGLNERLERHKGDIQLEVHRELEALKSDFAVRIHERQTRFSRWHERQIETLADLYSRLSHALNAHRPLLGPREYRLPDSADQALDSARQLATYFRENQIFIPPELESDVTALLNSLAIAYVDLGSRQDPGPEARREANDRLLREAPELLDRIRDQARKILRDGAAPPLT